VPKPVKKTFAQQISTAVLEQRMKGAAVKPTNEPTVVSKKPEQQAATSAAPSPLEGAKPGDADAFRAWARDLNA
jgi:hypothetical protein